ncbi:serine hydrolase domain-containing protein [Actinomadura xylanilytica]|uniref:serine hydrolase domain-containing protein n=1 Tax=Actinomadura xylanilytica TaxID=887459 RepID=UPI00255AEF55|nr:serine hydrolase domain-containing protein [Actinomadura xylanilytica]MDL4772435.1 serine hydrolase domain-containing protein [Actinomadura xylanilytica]
MIRTSRKILVAALSGAVLAVTAASVPLVASRGAEQTARPQAGASADVQALLDDLVESKAATAALVRIQRDGREQAAGAGVGDLASGRRADPSGHFRIGSVTKTFVATVLLQLTDEKRLGLDDPVERHLPGVVPDGGHITVRQLLDHTSGLHDYMSEPGYSTNRWRGADRFRSYTSAQLLKVAFAKPPNFPPGTQWRYSNTNYVVLGQLIEKITGRPYGQEVQRRILGPLHLTRTSVPGDRPGLPAPYAHGYKTLPTGRTVDATRMNPSLDGPAGEMISTAADLDRFFDALLSGRLTSAPALAAMRTTTPTGAGFDYGLGLQRYTLPCGASMWGHSGELIGYMTFAFRSDDGRRMTLSLNPGARNPTEEQILPIAAAAICD